MSSEFVARKTNRYTFKVEKSSFRTAMIYKDGKPHLRGAASEANDFCQKWNGVRGDFEIKDDSGGWPDTGRAFR